MRPTKDKNEGEGSKSADRSYREGVQRHLATHDVEKEARDAANALDDKKQAAELAEAEKAARKPRK